MKKIFLFMLLIFVPAIVINSCDDGGGNGGGSSITDSPAGTFMKQFGITDSGDNMFPFDGTRDTKTQYLYTPSEIGGAGYITTIRMRQSVETASPVSCPNVTIKMGHTNLITLTTAFSSNVGTGQGAELTVLDNRNLTIPAGSIGDWINIPLDIPFYFNGHDNLVVDIERTTRCSSTVETTFQDTTDRRAHSTATDATPGVADYSATTASLGRFLPWMQFVFRGGEICPPTIE